MEPEDREVLERFIRAQRDQARIHEITADAFRAEFDGCWEIRPDGSMGALKSSRAGEIRDLVLEGPSQAKHCRRLADLVEQLLQATD